MQLWLRPNFVGFLVGTEHTKILFLQEYKVSDVHAEADGEDQLIKLVNCSVCRLPASCSASLLLCIVYTCTCESYKQHQ